MFDNLDHLCRFMFDNLGLQTYGFRFDNLLLLMYKSLFKYRNRILEQRIRVKVASKSQWAKFMFIRQYFKLKHYRVFQVCHQFLLYQQICHFLRIFRKLSKALDQDYTRLNYLQNFAIAWHHHNYIPKVSSYSWNFSFFTCYFH